ncbi:MAG: hypothetical protein WDA75_08200 [Candidatus Latescibacterota bacterium]|jgi:hypothetical protein
MLKEMERPRTEELTDGESPLEPDEEVRLKHQVLELSQRITAMAGGESGLIEDVATAQEVAQKVKPYVDRLVALERLLNPVDRIIDKRSRIEELRAGIVDDVAEVEGLSGDLGETLAPQLITDLQCEVAAVKRDRKLFVAEVPAEEEAATGAAPETGRTLLDLPLEERFTALLGSRFIPASRVAEVLGGTLPQDVRTAYERALARVWDTILANGEFRPHVEQNRIKALQRTFRDYALLCRIPWLYGPDPALPPTPCSLEALRRRFEGFFLDLSERSLWYTDQAFYRTPLAQPQWALVDRQYLNCTFKKPSIRLLIYARANQLPIQAVRQKSVLEDVYDRIVLQRVLGEFFFESCNSITNTVYQPDRKAPHKQVYVYDKDALIRISGKRGTPHWRPTRPRWPGVMPSVLFPV